MGNDDGWLDQVGRRRRRRRGAVAAADAQPPAQARSTPRSPTSATSAPAVTAGRSRPRCSSEFVGDGIAWAHLDIAGPAFYEADGEVPKGGTGFGVRTLARLMAGFKKPGRAPVA